MNTRITSMHPHPHEYPHVFKRSKAKETHCREEGRPLLAGLSGGGCCVATRRLISPWSQAARTDAKGEGKEKWKTIRVRSGRSSQSICVGGLLPALSKAWPRVSFGHSFPERQGLRAGTGYPVQTQLSTGRKGHQKEAEAKSGMYGRENKNNNKNR